MTEEKLSDLEGKVLDKTTQEKAAAKAEKREKFVKLAGNRTRNAIKAIRVIGKLGNKSAYDFSADDVNKITKALSKEVEALKARMSRSDGKDAVEFEL